MFKFSFGEKSYLGVDIGTASIKIVELENSAKGPTLKNYGILESRGHLERLNYAIQTSGLKILEEETVQLLQILLKELKPKGVEVAASLPAFSAFTTLLEMPLMSPEEISKTMPYQIKAFVPLPLEEVTIDWLPIGEVEDEKGIKKQQIFLVAVPNEQIRKYQTIFANVGLKLRALEIETISLARVLTGGDPTTSLIIDIGARSTAIAVAAAGNLKYNSQTDFSSNALTQAISKGLGITIPRAEELKKTRGLTGTGGEYEVSTLMMPYLDAILNEARRVKEVYEKDYQAKVDRIILSGGGANLLGLEKYVTAELGLTAIKASPFAKVGLPGEITSLTAELGPTLAVALGLGLKQIKK
ncbi:MAG: type IV pilus assembly protein PilM [Candidatus Colwellbacteria bacterium]|nr:type IV pilus assembly protein PilM [Candidatus Colwellbacteria bacterium]